MTDTINHPAHYTAGGVDDNEHISPARRSHTLQEYEADDDVIAAFSIEDDQAANWAVRKIIAAKREQAEMVDHLKRQIDIVNKRYEADEQYFTALLEDYFKRIPHKKTTTQESYQLKNAKLVHKYARERLEPDKKALLQWLLDNERAEYIRVEYAALWDEYKKGLVINDGQAVDKETGEIVQGVNVIVKPAEFKLEAITDG